jgi:hypothetical protein
MSNSSNMSNMSIDELTKIFNSALIATRAASSTIPSKDIAGEMLELVQSQSFRAILMAVRQLAVLEGKSEREAAEQLINAFRKIDSLWADYVFAEGLKSVRDGVSRPRSPSA